MGVRGKVPLFLNLGTRWRLVLKFMPLPLLVWDGTAVGPRTGLGVSEKRKISCTYQGSNDELSGS